MSLKKDIIGADVQINSNEAQKSLVDLTQKTSALANENDRLRITQAKLKALGKENTEEYKKITKAISDNSKQIKENNTQMDALRKTIGVTEMSTKQLSKRALELRRELSGMSQASDPERFNKLNQELIETERQMRKNKAAIGETKEAVNPLIETAKGLLPAFGFAAIGAAAGAFFKKVVSSTDELGTQWDAQMNGMKMASDEFFRTIATGNWSRFMERMKEAIKTGKDYIETLDDVEEKTRALAIIEANSRKEELDLEEKLKNKGLSNQERLKAGQDRIKLEEDLAKKRTDVAQQVYDAELSVSMMESQLSKDQLEAVMSDFNSIDKQQAKAYIETKKRYEDLQQSEAGFREGQGRGVRMANPFTDKLAEAKKELESFPETIKVYAQAVSGAGRTTDEQLNKTVDAWVKLKEAQNSSVENIKKVRNQVNTLLAGEDDNGQQLEDKARAKREKAAKKEIEAVENTFNEKNRILIDQRNNEQITQDQFDKQSLENDMQLLMWKKNILTQYGLDVSEIDNQINQKRLKAQEDANKAFADEMKKVSASTESNSDSYSASDMGVDNSSLVTEEDLLFASKKHSLDEWVNYLILKTNEQVDIKKKQLESDKKIEEARQDLIDTQMSGIEQLSGQLASMFEDGSAAQIAALAVEKAAAIAQIWINYAKELSFISVTVSEMNALLPGSGIAYGVLAKKKAMANAIIGTALVGMQAIAGKQAGGFAETDASDSMPKGVYHANEFIGSAPTVRNPTIRKVYNIIDMAQKQGKAATLNLPAVMASMGMVPAGKQAGGFATSTNYAYDVPGGSDPELKQILRDATDAINEWRKYKPSISIEKLDKAWAEYDKVVKGGLK